MKCAPLDQRSARSRHSGGPPRVPPKNVLVLCPGGLEHGGGIGRQMGYFLAALPQTAETPAYRVIDTRGPWFLGSARWRVPLSSLYLMAAAFRIAWAGIAGRPSLLHVNITGRGSTMRKLALTAIARAVALPYVLHIHDYDYAADVRARGGVMRRLVRGMFAAAEQIIVLGDGGGAGLCAPRSRCRTRPSWSCRTRCPIRTPRRGRRRTVRGNPVAPRVPRLSQRPQGRAGTVGGVGEPGAGRPAMARDARRRRPGGRIPGPRRRSWPR